VRDDAAVHAGNDPCAARHVDAAAGDRHARRVGEYSAEAVRVSAAPLQLVCACARRRCAFTLATNATRAPAVRRTHPQLAARARRRVESPPRSHRPPRTLATAHAHNAGPATAHTAGHAHPRLASQLDGGPSAGVPARSHGAAARRAPSSVLACAVTREVVSRPRSARGRHTNGTDIVRCRHYRATTACASGHATDTGTHKL
jgi:hypothetical protein